MGTAAAMLGPDLAPFFFLPKPGAAVVGPCRSEGRRFPSQGAEPAGVGGRAAPPIILPEDVPGGGRGGSADPGGAPGARARASGYEGPSLPPVPPGGPAPAHPPPPPSPRRAPQGPPNRH